MFNTVPSESYCFNAPCEIPSTESSLCLLPPPSPESLNLYEHRWLVWLLRRIHRKSESHRDQERNQIIRSSPFHMRLCPRGSFCRGLCKISLSDLALAKNRVGSKSISYTSILEWEGSSGLHNRTLQVTFSCWSALESFAAGNWHFKNMIKGSHVKYHLIWEISPLGMQCLTFPLVSVNNKR